MKYPTLWKVAAVLISQVCLTPVLAAPAKSASGKSYTVKSGDTFAKIARANHIPLSDLLRANHISNPDRILQGQRLTIPGSGAAAKTATGAKTSTKTANAKTTTAKSGAAKLSSTNGNGRNSKTASGGSNATGSSRSAEKNTTVNITPPPAPAGTYVVQSGDTLNRIQRRTGTPVSKLLKLNGLSETSVIRPGQKLRINGTAPAMAKTRPATPAAVEPRTTPRQPLVEPHDQEPAAVINAPEVPRTAEPAAPAAPMPSTTAPHKVEPGETFASIGRRYGVTHSKLVAANPGVNPSKLKTGQKLLIPGQASKPVVRPDGRILANQEDPLGPGTPVSVPAERTRTGYLVEEGETLTEIAQRFHTTERELRQLNRLGESDTIYSGRYILVPFRRQAPQGNTLAQRDA